MSRKAKPPRPEYTPGDHTREYMAMPEFCEFLRVNYTPRRLDYIELMANWHAQRLQEISDACRALGFHHTAQDVNAAAHNHNDPWSRIAENLIARFRARDTTPSGAVLL